MLMFLVKMNGVDLWKFVRYVNRMWNKRIVYEVCNCLNNLLLNELGILKELGKCRFVSENLNKRLFIVILFECYWWMDEYMDGLKKGCFFLGKMVLYVVIMLYKVNRKLIVGKVFYLIFWI